MEATEISASYFYVWTPKGLYTQEIKFDEKLWEELKLFSINFMPTFMCHHCFNWTKGQKYELFVKS